MARRGQALDADSRHPFLDAVGERGIEVTVLLAPHEERRETRRPAAALRPRRVAKRRAVVIDRGRERARPAERLLVEKDVVFREGAGPLRVAAEHPLEDREVSA